MTVPFFLLNLVNKHTLTLTIYKFLKFLTISTILNHFLSKNCPIFYKIVWFIFILCFSITHFQLCTFTRTVSTSYLTHCMCEKEKQTICGKSTWRRLPYDNQYTQYK